MGCTLLIPVIEGGGGEAKAETWTSIQPWAAVRYKALACHVNFGASVRLSVCRCVQCEQPSQQSVAVQMRKLKKPETEQPWSA